MRVCDLKKLIFSDLSLEARVEIKNNGRPTPLLNITQTQKGCKSRTAFTRKFDKNVYDKFWWLCGCDETNAFFCFICLLFEGEENWTKIGVRDLKHLTEKSKKHENSLKHKNSLVSYQLLGNTNIASRRAYAEQLNNHNERVKKNRLVLSKIIDILKLCGTCNLPLRGHNEESNSTNKGVFLEIVDYTRKIDSIFDAHYRDADVFKGTSKAIQNELLQCMLEVCKDHILKEIDKSSFVSVMSDDTTDISTQYQMVLVFRYELKGQIFERFWGFFNPEGQDGDLLSKCILHQLDLVLKNPNKLICQTYDGAAIMGGHSGGVNVKIQEIYKNAHFVYCYAHQFNEVLEQAVSSISSVKCFFYNFNGIASFFSNSPERIVALKEVCDKTKILRSSQTSWTTNSHMVQTIFGFKEELFTCFENIALGHPKKFNSETTAMAAGFVKWLEDDGFLFWLRFFSEVMPHVDFLYNQLQKNQSDPVQIQIAVDYFSKEIENIRANLSLVEGTSEQAPKLDEIINTKKKRKITRDDNLNESAREVCDIITFQVRERFSFKNHLSGANLFLKEKYAEYQKSLPLKDIEQFCKAYPSFIDKQILITELTIFYSRAEIVNNSDVSGCLKTLNFILSLGLDTAFKEIMKTLQILVTTPMQTAEPERCFSKLKIIKTFLRDSMCEARCEDCLNAFGMLSIESAMVETISDFNEKVIEKFVANKDRRVEFHYKK